MGKHFHCWDILPLQDWIVIVKHPTFGLIWEWINMIDTPRLDGLMIYICIYIYTHIINNMGQLLGYQQMTASPKMDGLIIWSQTNENSCGSLISNFSCETGKTDVAEVAPSAVGAWETRRAGLAIEGTEGFMEVISIVSGDYKPSYNWGVPP